MNLLVNSQEFNGRPDFSHIFSDISQLREKKCPDNSQLIEKKKTDNSQLFLNKKKKEKKLSQTTWTVVIIWLGLSRPLHTIGLDSHPRGPKAFCPKAFERHPNCHLASKRFAPKCLDFVFWWFLVKKRCSRGFGTPKKTLFQTLKTNFLGFGSKFI